MILSPTIFILVVNPSDAKTILIWDTLVNTMAAGGLAPCVTEPCSPRDNEWMSNAHTTIHTAADQTTFNIITGGGQQSNMQLLHQGSFPLLKLLNAHHIFNYAYIEIDIFGVIKSVMRQKLSK